MKTSIGELIPGALALFVAALLTAGCSGGGRPAAPKAETSGAATAEPVHAETFEAAKTLASTRHVPILVDFFSPT